jgi:hypothetical protein
MHLVFFSSMYGFMVFSEENWIENFNSYNILTILSQIGQKMLAHWLKNTLIC